MANIDNKATKEIGLKTVFTFILNGLFSAFFVTSGVINFKEKKIIVGLLYFVLAALALLPHRFLKVTQALKIVILIILFVILAGVAAQGNPIAEQKYEYYKVGQEFNLKFGDNTFATTVRNVSQETKIIAQGKEATTSGLFLVVKVDIVNLGSESLDFITGKDPELKDNQKRVYALYGADIPQGKLQPSVAKRVSYVFEIPKDSKGLSFIFKDKTDIAKSVDLGR
ncbi:hypothetical protein A2V61_03225 [Candidatus Woesebacteria bacterium RBG_19FT_COMBO_47_8]|uniref:DUF4352 domain-containing protein n=1 Tax=Candidatus Woesebacteria bacterium RBG_13_46_13 TaxID=1802479 RepID=A0A1F7X5E6_9BACT|nr:MAG: hypothetical protein A2Y68_02650 [Candidatus Woesebacteria bacterium RBG_13_46_13]OGM16699.1 MAG: hypothetical protein A2V61_03225 [Candidatus Woesebacteria bacterium RBG_19FT_COMBO_47_8]HJX59099.1 DUF4352 domain-containing protein [Patescibacteria group bacterium]